MEGARDTDMDIPPGLEPGTSGVSACALPTELRDRNARTGEWCAAFQGWQHKRSGPVRDWRAGPESNRQSPAVLAGVLSYKHLLPWDAAGIAQRLRSA